MIEVTLALLADAANFAAQGQLNILGEFNSLQGDEPPVGMVGKVLVFRLVGSPEDEGPHRISLRILDEDRTMLWSSGDGQFQFPKTRLLGTPAKIQSIQPMPPVVFPAFGTYELEFIVDGRMAGGMDIHAVRRGELSPNAGP